MEQVDILKNLDQIKPSGLELQAAREILEGKTPDEVVGLVATVFKQRDLLIEESGIDSRTGLVNFRGLGDEFKRVTEVLIGTEKELAGINFETTLELDSRIGFRNYTLVFADILNFHEYNKAGQLKGNEALRGVGEELREIFRETDIVASVGGDEFLMVLPNQTFADDEEVKQLYSRIDKIMPFGLRLHMTAMSFASDKPFDEAFKEIDQAQKEVKDMGKKDKSGRTIKLMRGIKRGENIEIL